MYPLSQYAQFRKHTPNVDTTGVVIQQVTKHKLTLRAAKRKWTFVIERVYDIDTPMPMYRVLRYCDGIRCGGPNANTNYSIPSNALVWLANNPDASLCDYIVSGADIETILTRLDLEFHLITRTTRPKHLHVEGMDDVTLDQLYELCLQFQYANLGAHFDLAQLVAARQQGQSYLVVTVADSDTYVSWCQCSDDERIVWLSSANVRDLDYAYEELLDAIERAGFDGGIYLRLQ